MICPYPLACPCTLSQNESGLSYVFTQQKPHGKIRAPYIKYDRNMEGGIRSLCVPVVLLLGGPCGVLEISFQVLDGVVHLLEHLFDVLHRDPGGGVEVEDLLFEGEELRKVPLHVLNQEVKQSPGILAVLGVVELGQVTDVAKKQVEN